MDISTTNYDLRLGPLAARPGAAEPGQERLIPAAHVWRAARPRIARAGRALGRFGRVWLDAQARAAGLLCDER